jgi:hypothetical protein
MPRASQKMSRMREVNISRSDATSPLPRPWVSAPPPKKCQHGLVILSLGKKNNLQSFSFAQSVSTTRCGSGRGCFSSVAADVQHVLYNDKNKQTKEENRNSNQQRDQDGCNGFRLRDRLATACRDLQPALQVAVDVEQTPMVFPTLGWSIVCDLPRLVERFEPRRQPVLACFISRHSNRMNIPKIICAIGHCLANPIVHELVHIVDTRHSAGRRIRAGVRWRTIIAAL